MSLEIFSQMNGVLCSCGKVHSHTIKKIFAGEGAINNLSTILSTYNKAFILSDPDTYAAAGNAVCTILDNINFPYSNYIINKKPEPDEKSVGSVMMHYDKSCDIIIAVGSGVINDLGKILSNVSNNDYIIVATAPSMDGFASATSSMTRDGLKISLPSRNADYIIGDTNILCNAPLHMLLSGLGDMIAKYISICEWRISNLITGEYYCEKIAELVRYSLKKCISNSTGLVKRDKKAVLAVFEGLVICGAAMTYAGLSRPASGCEHYLSHIWDMRNVEFKTNADLHGIQCALGTLIISRMYQQLKEITPDKDKAIAYVNNFNVDNWYSELETFLGRSSKSMIELDKKEQKYDIKAHSKRLDIIINNWDKIINIINEEVPSYDELKELYTELGLPLSMDSIGLTEDILPMTFKSSKDIRDKYVLSRLAWDLGIIDEIKY